MQKRAKPQKAKKPEPEKSKPLSQADRVYEYLIERGIYGATNFGMMLSLRICDVRKRISELGKSLETHTIESIYEENNGKRYKRYWAVPIKYQGNLWRWLDESKHIASRHGTSGASKRGKRTI